MICGVYGDVHLTKNMRNMQSTWEESAKSSLYSMYDTYDTLNIEVAICLGDFFDAPKLEAKHMNFVLPILENINSRAYPTYILLGNHEADTESANILEFLSQYENIHPVTSITELDDFVFYPYYVDLDHVDVPDKIILTHHDIYGSQLASGKTTAFFGVSPSVFSQARLVLNGHVHLKSQVTPNILNVGSLLVGSQGELKVSDYPSYYTFDSKSIESTWSSYDNLHSMIFLTVTEEEIEKVTSTYPAKNLVLKVEYKNDLPQVDPESALHVSYRKLVGDIESKSSVVKVSQNFEMKNYLTEYIKSDSRVSQEDKDSYVITGLELLS